MKTDNSIIDNESLQNAAKNYFDNEYTYLDTPSWSFQLGANYQQAKDKVIIDKLLEALKQCIGEFSCYDLQKETYQVKEKAANLIAEIEKQ